jgi:hypothetical protein
MDEVGLAMAHSSLPNFQIQPVTVAVDTAAPGGDSVVRTLRRVVLAWPVQDVEVGEVISRDFLCSCRDWRDSGIRATLLSAGLLPPNTEGPTSRMLESILAFGKQKIRDQVQNENYSSTKLGYDKFRSDSIASAAVLAFPSTWDATLRRLEDIRSSAKPLRIYMDKTEYLYGHLQPGAFQNSVPGESPIVLVDSPSEADVLYLIDHTYSIAGTDSSGKETQLECEHFKGGKMLNQFWWEGLLVTKQMLARTVNRYYNVYNLISGGPLMLGDTLPIWFPASYDMKDNLDLCAFIDHFNDWYDKTSGYLLTSFLIVYVAKGVQKIETIGY